MIEFIALRRKYKNSCLFCVFMSLLAQFALKHELNPITAKVKKLNSLLEGVVIIATTPSIGRFPLYLKIACEVTALIFFSLFKKIS